MRATTAEVVSILAHNRQPAVERLEKLAKRAARYGQSITWTQTPRTEVRKIRNWYGKDRTIRIEWIDLAIVGTAPSAGDFRFLSTLDRQPGGVLIQSVPGVEIGDLGRAWDGRCEHCGQNRARRQAFIVEDLAGDRKIVGRSCLKDYVGTATPADLMRIFSTFRDVEDLGDEDGGWGFRGRWEWSTIGVVAASRAAIALWGWRPGSSEGTTTRNYVGLLWERIDPKSRERLANQRRLLAELKARGEHYEETADEVLAWGRALKPRGDYEHNLTVALAGDVVTDKTLGLVVSASAAFDRQVAVEEERKAKDAAQPPSHHVGRVGERLSVAVTVERLIGLPDYGFGPSMIYVLRADDGALISWKTSSYPTIAGKPPEVGDKLLVSGTVKGHADFKGTPETRLTRAKLAAAVQS